MRSTLGNRGPGRHASLRPRLFATALVAACLGLFVVSAIGIQKTYGATKTPPKMAAPVFAIRIQKTHSATKTPPKLPPLPVCAFDFSSKYEPSAGEAVPYTLSFSICKSVKLTLKEVRPAEVTKIEVLDKPQPTRFVHGGPVWVQNVSWRTYFTRSLRLTFKKGLKTGQKVQQTFILSAPGYQRDVETIRQTVYNP
jgi:hypothetical protein